MATTSLDATAEPGNSPGTAGRDTLHAQRGRVSSGSFRLVALDIDGTLLTPQGHVSPRTVAAVRAVCERGVLVVLCTGRSFSRGIGALGAELGLHLPAIVRNGAAVQDIATGEVLAQRAIAPAAVRAALDAVLAAGATPLVQEGARHRDAICLPPPDECGPAALHFERLWRAEGDTFVRVASTAALYDAREPWWIGGAGSRDDTARACEALRRIPGLLVRWSGDESSARDQYIASSVPEGCTKAAALAEFAAQHGVSLAEVFAVGDYYNDVEMLREVGFGVAMGQAPDVVKAAARAVAPDNARDGCAIALERYVLDRD
jgi:hydroxymethylpyrimidine pyrophosphatase-like HAD family hydrolase